MTIYEITASVQKLQKDGNNKRVTEKYLIRNAENDLLLAVKDTTCFIELSGEIELTACKKTKIAEIFGDRDKSEHVFDAKVCIFTLDDKTSKEKRTTIEYAVWANDIDEARKIVHDEFERGLLDYKITDLHETAYVDIIAPPSSLAGNTK